MKQTTYITPGYEYLETWLNNITDNFNQGGEVVYKARNIIKVFRNIEGLDINVKRYHKPKGINSLVYSYNLRKPKGLRAMEYAQILEQRGIATPKVLAYIEERNSLGTLGYSYLVTEQINYDMRMYEVGNAKEGTYEALAKQLAAFAADMHEKEVLHKDFSPGNILVNIENKDSDVPIYHFTIIDINRMHFGYVSMEDACKNFSRLWGPKRFMQVLISVYCHLRGFNAVAAEATLMAHRRKFWHKYIKANWDGFKIEL